MKDDILQADKYSELGAFRHKKHTEINAEKIFKQLKEREYSFDPESDDANDYTDQLTKNTLDDPNYEHWSLISLYTYPIAESSYMIN